MANIFQQTVDPDEPTGSTSNPLKQVMDPKNPLAGGIQGIFDKLKNAGGPEVPAVPVGRLVASPRRQLGRGTRDTILNGADGL